VTRRFPQDIEQKLDVARKLFAEFDTDRNGSLDESEILQLLKKTYQQLNINNYKVTDDDVRSLIELATG
jgi:Ca2+-binding EF-hand superfamily protein